ncbi:O-antigen polymerase [Vibrio scophthalmi]|uniref:O-antigen polymerase n=1 Tax=Vibrio scophthalmi TaxID=45658 RepID=UPI003872E4FB
MRWFFERAHTLTLFYVIAFSVCALDNGNSFYVSPSLFFLNPIWGYSAIIFLMFFSSIYVFLMIVNGRLDKYFFIFFISSCMYLMYFSILYGRVEYLTYRQIGFSIFICSTFFLLDVRVFSRPLCYAVMFLAFFSFLISIQLHQFIYFPIIAYKDFGIASSFFSATGGLFVQTNASGAFFCLSFLVFQSFVYQKKENIYKWSLLFSFVGLLCSMALGPLFLAMFFSVFYLNKKYFLIFLVLFIFVFVFNFEYITYYLSYKLNSGVIKYEVFLSVMDHLFTNPSSMFFGQLNYVESRSLLYTESSFLDLVLNFGFLGVLFLVLSIGVMIDFVKHERLVGAFRLFIPVISFLVLSITQNSVFLISNLIVIFIYLAFVRQVVTQGELRI